MEGRPPAGSLRPCCPVNRRHRVITPSQLQLHLVHTVPRKHSTTVTLHHGITTMYSRVPSWYFHGYIRSLHPKLAQFLPISSWDLSLRRKLAFGSFGKRCFHLCYIISTDILTKVSSLRKQEWRILLCNYFVISATNVCPASLPANVVSRRRTWERTRAFDFLALTKVESTRK